MGFILHIINPCAVSWSLYSTLLIPIRGHGVCSLVNEETLLDLQSELRSDTISATTIDVSGIRTLDSLCANQLF